MYSANLPLKKPNSHMAESRYGNLDISLAASLRFSFVQFYPKIPHRQTFLFFFARWKTFYDLTNVRNMCVCAWRRDYPRKTKRFHPILLVWRSRNRTVVPIFVPTSSRPDFDVDDENTSTAGEANCPSLMGRVEVATFELQKGWL